MERVQRYDLKSGGVTGRRRTSSGGLVADARVTRTGVLTYRMPDGSSRREYRPPEEVFAPESLATLAHATLTDDHPGKVTPQNWRRNTIGHLGADVKPDGKFVAAELHLQHDDAIDKADTGELSECSCGYDCAFDPTPGKSPEGETYDGIQRNIRYNHVALGPQGWGRAGPQVRMRLDAANAGISGEAEAEPHDDAAPHVVVHHTSEGGKTVTIHPTKASAIAAGKALREHGASAYVFSVQNYKTHIDPSFDETKGTVATGKGSSSSAGGGGDFDESKHPRDEQGRFNSLDSTAPYVRGMKTAEELQKELDIANEKARLANEKAIADSKVIIDRLDAIEKANKTLEAENALFKSRESKFSEDAKRQADTAAAQATAAKFDSAVKEMVTLYADGKRFLGQKWTSDGKSAEQIQRELVTHWAPEYVADKKNGFDKISPELLAHVYGLERARADKHDDAWDGLQDVIAGARNDARGGAAEEPAGEEGSCDAMAEQKKMHDRKKDGAKARRDRERKAADARGAR